MVMTQIHPTAVVDTKAEIEHNKQQDELAKWQGDAASLARLADAFTARPRPAALDDWEKKPGKAAKMRAWYDSISRAAERLRKTS